MTRTAYDSTSAADLPTGGDLYLAYVDGRYANIAAVRKRFPRTPVVGITVTGSTLDAEIADVETGDLTNDSGAAWAARKHAAGQIGTLYTYASNLPALRRACQARGLRPGVDVMLFSAQYDGKAVLPAGCVGKQHSSPDGPVSARPKGHYDVSVVADHWPGVDPPPPARKTRLSPVSRMLARHLTRRLARRHTPLASGVDVLTALGAQIKRVKGLK